jgi:purine-binding chemotaxis protein CheW
MGVAAISDTRQYLTFKLSDEVFAVDVAQVREILDLTPITKVPRSPEFMRGVINLRGSVVPVVDMRLKFGMPKTEYTINTCIVVVEVNIEGEPTILGAMADSVQEVFELMPGQIDPPPRIGTSLRLDFIHGIGKRDDLFIMVLDIDKVFSVDELGVIMDASASAETSSGLDAGEKP